MSPEPIEDLPTEKDDQRIALLTIENPDNLNALNTEILDEIDLALTQFEKDENYGVLIITGAGEKAFAAGADIKELSSLTKEDGEKLSKKGQDIFNRIESCGKPVIALVNGYALGGGAELAMACHIRIATENAVIGLPEVSLGIIPGYGGTQRLPRLVGKSKAMEMILTGQPVKAEEAKKLGLVNDVLPLDEALNHTKKIALKMLENGPLALSKAIAAVNSAYPNNGFAAESTKFGELCETDDFKEGTTAFLEKRKAEFKGH